MKNPNGNLTRIENEAGGRTQIIYACKDIDSLNDADYDEMNADVGAFLEQYNYDGYKILHVYDYCEEPGKKNSEQGITLGKVKYRPRPSAFTKFSGDVYVVINACTDVCVPFAIGGLTLFIPQRVYALDPPRIVLDECARVGYFGENGNLFDDFFKWIIKTFPGSGYVTDYGLICDIREYAKLLPPFTAAAFAYNIYLPLKKGENSR